MSYIPFNSVTSSMFSGTTQYLNVTVVDANGQNYNLSGSYAKFVAKHDFTSSLADITKDTSVIGGITYTSASLGMLSIELDASDTALLTKFSSIPLYFQVFVTGSLTSGSLEQQTDSVLNGTIFLTKGVE